MMKHGEEYDYITSLDVGEDVNEEAFNTLMSGNKPRVVFSEGNVNAGDQVIFKAETTFLPYTKFTKTFGMDEAAFHRWIPGYGAAHSTWEAADIVYPTNKYSSRVTAGTEGWDKNLPKGWELPWCYPGSEYTVTKKDEHLEEGEYTAKEQDSVDRLEEEISAWAVFSPEKKVDRNVTFETLSGGVGEDHIKFKVDTGESKHGDSKDTVVIMAFGK